MANTVIPSRLNLGAYWVLKSGNQFVCVSEWENSKNMATLLHYQPFKNVQNLPGKRPDHDEENGRKCKMICCMINRI